MNESHTGSALFELRPATPEDESFLFELYASTRAEEIASWGWDDETQASFLAIQFKAQQGAYLAQYPSADHKIIVAGCQPIGRLLVDKSDQEIVLVDIALAPEMRGAGIGSTLLKMLLAEAADTGRPIRLHVLLTNPARRLYDRAGFVSLGHDGIRETMEWRAQGPGRNGSVRDGK